MMNTINFMKQINRNDVLTNILKNKNIPVKKLYKILLTDNNTSNEYARKGFLFETLSIILLISKCLNINYTNILDGQLQSLKICKNISNFLKINIVQGNNPADLTIKQGDDIVPISIKYKKKFLPRISGVSEIDGEMINAKIRNYKIGLIVKDKSLVENHNYKNDNGNQKNLHNMVVDNKLLLDRNDIIVGLEKFCNNFKDYNVDDFIEMVNKDYLLSGRERLKLKLHQKMTFMQFIGNEKQKLHLVSHKPRSGKSITILNICKYLLENKMNKILIMTSVPATIKSFIDDLDKYIDFKDIKYKEQKDFKYINNDFTGIVFCSVQYLKTRTNKKKRYLKKIGFNAMIIDECHVGSSTKNTENNILNVDVDEIRNNIKLNIFASGTSDKTKKYYKIKNVYCWDIEDEGYMKRLISDEITNAEITEILDIMKCRHGIDFISCFNDPTINKDYSKYPTQVLMKHHIPVNIIEEIKQYNELNNTNYGYSCSSIFALDKIKDKKTSKCKYDNIFELEKTSDGTELLKSFFECIISNNRMNQTSIMKQIEKTQSDYRSRISQKGNPKLFLMYLPTHTRNNNISQLQKTFKQFIEKHKLWTDYTIEYTNSIEDSGDYKEEYITYITTILDKTVKKNKKGCILLLGNKGGVGITYHDCDVTISLDDDHNLDNQRQRYSRALTEENNKTIGINVDMNIQRTYLYLNDVIHKHRTITKTTRTNGEILTYLYAHNIFLFNPQDINNGRVKTFEITEYFNKEAENILKNIDDVVLLNQIIVIDSDIILDENEIAVEFTWNDITNQPEAKIMNSKLEGEQQDCPKGDITRVYIDNENSSEQDDDKSEEQLTKVEEELIEKQKRILKEVCRRVLFPLLALLSRSNQNLEFKEMLFHANTKEIVNGILKDKKIILNKNSYNSIIRIMENNNEIINNIREIYRSSPSNIIHQLIAKHFIPSKEEKKNNAEIPTPLVLVNEMLDKIPKEFWETPKRVFEPCCGKGNFVMKIFEKFYNGLVELYPDEKERCTIIINKCIYFADLTPMNVFITTEILKCEIQSRTGIEEEEYKFNSYVGDTLQIDIKEVFNIRTFNAVFGNPPYNSNGDTATGNTIWQDFTRDGLIKWLCKNGLLLFVHPPGWRKPCYKKSQLKGLFELMTHRNHMMYLSIHGITDGMTTFRCGTKYDWYLIKKTSHDNTTYINDENNKKYIIDLKKFEWLPNYNITEIQKIISNEPDNNLQVIMNSAYHATRKYVKDIKTDEYKYPLIHSTPISGIRYKYTNINNKGHFGIPKIIFGEAGINHVVVDIDGEYGMTQGAMGITIFDKNEGDNIKAAILTDKFNNILKACLWGNYRIDWKLFTYFKKDFWKYFINDESSENITNENKLEIIKKGRTNYYLVENMLYKINKDKSKGDYYCEHKSKKNIDKKSKEKKAIKDESVNIKKSIVENGSKFKTKLKKVVKKNDNNDNPVKNKKNKKKKRVVKRKNN